MKQNFIIYCVAIFFLAIGCKEESQTEIKMISTEEIQSLLEQDDIQLVDVRTLEEYQAGHIMKAQNIDILSPTFDDDIVKLDKSKPVVVYCKSGGRSAKCSKLMKAAGFVKIYDLDGGFEKWKFDELEIETID
ncbi:MAG: rhodanese-like domain-containing protein [Psychroserpens sp.]|uniref:rhodanese-like domain-containing protein n=1 Tax=Psychroserpens sp. TaxID=2020870 RepID=UPI003C78D695